MTPPQKPLNSECKKCGLLESTCNSKSEGCCDDCTHEFKGVGTVKKPLSAEELVLIIAHTESPETQKNIILSFAQQESEELVRALSLIKAIQENGTPEQLERIIPIAEEALQVHKTKQGGGA